VYAPSSALAPAIGRRLVRVDAQWHVFPGKPDSLIRFWLTFEGAGSFGFHVGEEFAALEVLAEPVDIDADMAQYGRLEVRPGMPPDPPACALGEILDGVEDLHEEGATAPTGARLRFASLTVSAADADGDLCWALGDSPVGSAS
jgi:hypothetical protein